MIRARPQATRYEGIAAPIVDWRNDACLAQFETVLSSPGLTHVSFDVFGTTLLRSCERPVDVFAYLGTLLVDRNMLPDGWTAEEFAEFRVEMERATRDERRPRNGDSEVTLAEVYGRMCLTPGFRGHVTEYCALELEAEKRLCFANPALVSLLESVAARGLKSLFISDTYLSRGALTELLKSCGVEIGNSRVFVSSEMRAGKYDGRLFEIVLEEQGISPQAMVHVGDSEISDCKGAAANGIPWVHYCAESEYLSAVVERERAGCRHKFRAVGRLNDLRLLAERQVRQVPPDEAPFFRYGATVLGPVMSSFANWAAHTFAVVGIRHVLALMREGKLLSDLMTDTARATGIELRATPCYVSREAVALPAILDFDEPTLRRFWWRRDVPTLERLGMSLKFDLEDVAHLGIDPQQPLNNEDLRSRVISALASSPLRQRIESEASHARQLLHKYLDDLVPLNEQVGILDLGWNATIQKCLQKVLTACGHSQPLVGCYLGLVGRWSQMRIDGLNVHAFLGTADQSVDALPTILRSPEILEQAISDNVGTTLGYQQHHETAVPVLSEFRCLPREAARRCAIRAGIRTFHQLALHVQSAVPMEGLFSLPAESVGLILKRLIDQPLAEEAFDLGSLHHDDNFGSDSWWPICDGYGESVFRAGGADALSSDLKVYWPQGILARNFSTVPAVAGQSHPGESTDIDAVQLSWSQDHTFAQEVGSVQEILTDNETVCLSAGVPVDCRHIRISFGAKRALFCLDEWAIETPDGRVRIHSDRVHGEGLLKLDEEGRRWIAYREAARMAAVLPKAHKSQIAHKRQVYVRLRRLAVPSNAAF